MLQKPFSLKPLVLALSLLTPLLSPLALAKEPVGQIVSIFGQAEYRETEQSPWQAATLRQQVVQASFVRTGPLSSVSLLLNDQAQIKLGQNTVFQVNAVSTVQRTGSILSLLRGRVWSQIKNVNTRLTMNTPTVAAGIHGTDWVMEVDDAGTTTMTVLSGVVELSNAAGRVSVNSGEQGYVEAGKAPIKRTLVNARERVQWVSTHRIDLGLYPELAQPGSKTRTDLTNNLRRNDYAAAAAQVLALRTITPEAIGWLLGGELALVAGDAPAAEAILKEGAAKYPGDRRFAVLLARTALFRDQTSNARDLLTPLVATHPDFVDAWLVKGEMERLEGNAVAATDAYDKATTLAPKDPRGWVGLGRVETERERVGPATRALDKAVETGGAGTAAAERGTLSTFLDDPASASSQFDEALKADPSDYVAWTGLGIARLKAGDNPGALEALLRANVIEPRYSRAVLYMAIAYYRIGKTDSALSSLQRATELDPNDPLPHLYAALIQRDEWRPAEAFADAQLANEKLPRLKSLNQLANDRQGSANLGGTLADLGLETWSAAVAQDSALTGWAGSHLFLADRYSGSYNRNSELMQGFLSDPTVFGAGIRRQSLVSEPGIHADLSASYQASDNSNVDTESASVWGYSNKYVPMAGFSRLQHIGIDARDATLDAQNLDLTVGFGIKPRYDLGLFFYGIYVDAETKDKDRGNPDLIRQDIVSNNNRNRILENNSDGRSWRFDIGATWKYSSEVNSTFKVGSAREEIDQGVAAGATDPTPTGVANRSRVNHPHENDVQWRVNAQLSQPLEFSFGVERVRREFDYEEFTTNRTSGLVIGILTEEESTDRRAWTQLRWRGATGHRAELLVADHQYEKTNNTTSFRVDRNGARVTAPFGSGSYEKDRTDVRFGLAVKASDPVTFRLAWQDWIRPTGFNTLMPVSDAGIPLADEYVLPGGRQERGRGQLEWKLGSRSFVQSFAEHIRVDNFRMFGEVQPLPDNIERPLAELVTLRGATSTNLPTVESLGNRRSLFTAGTIRQWGLNFSHLFENGLGWEAGYVHANTENRFVGANGRLVYPDAELPHFSKHRFATSLAGSHGMWRWQTQAVYRGKRFASEQNAEADSFDAGWELNLRLAWRSPSRAWQFELNGDGLGQEDGRVGITARYRY